MEFQPLKKYNRNCIACWLVVLSETESLSVLQKKVCVSEVAKIVQTPLQGPPSRLSALNHIDSMQYRYKNWNAGSEFFFVLADTRDSIKVLDRTYCVVSLLSELDTGDWVVCPILFIFLRFPKPCIDLVQILSTKYFGYFSESFRVSLY